MKIVFDSFLFIVGLAIGSFLNVVIYRLPRGLSFVWGRSFCPKCRQKISWFDNLPLFSFALLCGRCRYCRSPISWRYPLVEFLTGILFVLGATKVLGGGELGIVGIIEIILNWILFSALLAIFFIDFEHQIIPDDLVFPLIFLFLLFFLITDYRLLIANNLISAIGAFLFLSLIWLITKGKGMGLGDVKLAFLMGLVLGFPKILVAFYLAFLTGAIIGVILILVKRAKLGQKIAFGPFLVSATIIAVLWGEKIVAFVQKLLF